LKGLRLKVLGRSDDMTIVKGINVYPAEVKNVVPEFSSRTTREMRILLDQPRPKVPAPLHNKVEHVKEEKDLLTACLPRPSSLRNSNNWG